MSYADMLGMYKGAGKGVGPGLSPDEEQGGAAGIMRAGSGSLKGAGAGLMALDPTLSAVKKAKDQAQYGAYHDMMSTQQQQDRKASRHAGASQILQGLDAMGQFFKKGSEGGTDMPGGGFNSML